MARSFRRLAILLMLSIMLTACADRPVQVRQRFFFPPPPSEPKIEYLDSFFSDYDLRPPDRNLLKDAILGETPPQKIFEVPADVAADGAGRVFVSDQGTRQVVVLDFLKHQVRLLGAGENRSAAAVGFALPMGLTTDSRGYLYVCDSLSAAIQVFDARERLAYAFGGREHLERPVAVAVDLLHGRVYVVDPPQHRLAIFDLQGQFIDYLDGQAAAGGFNRPTDVAVDGNGRVYVLDTLNARVKVFEPDGKFVLAFGERGTAQGSFEMAKGIAVDPSSRYVYVTDGLAHKVLIFSVAGEFLLRFGGQFTASEGISPGGFSLPRGIDIDRNQNIWIVDTLNRGLHQYVFVSEAYLREHPLRPEEIYLRN